LSRPAERTHLPLLLGFIIAVGPVSVDMYLPAFGDIARQFGTAVPQLTLAAYFAGFAVGQMAQGILADRFGRRLPLAAGLVLYTIASVGCAAAQSAGMLCLFRALAAFGAAASIVVPRAMVRDLADGAQAAELMSGVMQVMSAAPVIAPLAGSLVLLAASWRWIFVLAALYGVAGILLLFRYLPETLPPSRRTAARPLALLRLYGTILREGGFLSNALVGTYGMAALFAYLAGAPAVFTGAYSWRQWQFGFLLALLGAATILFFRLNGWLVRRLGASRVISVGIMVWFAAALILVGLASAPPATAIPFALALLVFGLGYSFMPSNAQVGALSRHQDHAATATALMSTLQYVAGAIAGWLAGLLADGTARPMAFIMLICALGAATAACLRPPDVPQRFP
jgi:DHA1 family bicyclomycin/chloramphenicol resistance-like MFS transporter